MAVVSISRIQVRRGQENQTGVPTLAGGEFAWAADTEHLFIGLRREDGGARDANVRILTENDLLKIVTTFDETYSYRSDTDGLPYITAIADNVPFERAIREKSDDFVSIHDFGATGVGGAEVVSTYVQKAVDNLFVDPLKTTPTYGEFSAKVLYMPAGVYNINNAILVPKHTTIVGEGVDKTIINLISNASHAFQTVGVDPSTGNPVDFETGIGTGNTQPNYLHLQGMTIQYSTLTDVSQCLSLVSIDCSENAILRDVKLAGHHSIGDAATGDHSGIDIRGYGGMQGSSENLLIDNCEFDGLYHCIKSNYDVISPIIQNSKFKNSVRGISFNDTKNGAADVGPRNARIQNNRFENIEEQAIYSGLSNSTTGTNHVSSGNKFYNCGNYGIRENTVGTPVITFLTDGNISVNDWFDRQEYQNQHITTAQPYFPLIEGRATIDNGAVSTATLTNGVSVPITRLPITGFSQQLIIKYSLFEGIAGAYTVDRMGTFKLQLQPGVNPATPNVTDDYSYGVGGGTTDWTIVQNSGTNMYYEIQLKFSGAGDAAFEYQTSLVI
jgi:hypothetical protein